MTAEQLEDLGRLARAGGVGVIPGVNFSISGAMLQMAALRAARFLDRWEVTGYAAADKIDAPSGTACELASGQPRRPHPWASVLNRSADQRAGAQAKLHCPQMALLVDCST